jgi:hypothetical protein
VLAVAAYGPGVLSLRYLKGLFAPWAWYTGGVLTQDAYPWDTEGGYFFALAALIGSLSVIAYLSTGFRGSRRPVPFAASGLVFLGFVSLFLHAKYVVQLSFAYWAGTALPALAVMAWAVKHFGPRLYRLAIASAGPRAFPWLRRGRVPRVLAALTGLVGAAWLADGAWGGDATMVYGLRSYWGYNSLLNTAVRSALGQAGVRYSPLPVSVLRRHGEGDVFLFFMAVGDVEAYRTEADVELIRGNTEPGERVAIVSWFDWAFLLEAKRPPRYFILPVPTTQGIPSQVEELARVTNESRVLFIDKRWEGLLTDLAPGWLYSFRRAGESDNLLLYRQRWAGPGQRPRAGGADGGPAVETGEGSLDGVSGATITGWAWDSKRPDTPIAVDIYDGATLLATGRADLMREDLVQARIGNGEHGFIYPTPARLKDGKSHTIRVRISGADKELGGSPKALGPPES